MLYEMTEDQNKIVLLSIILPRVVVSLEKDRTLITHSKLRFFDNYIRIIDELIDALNHEAKLCRNALRRDLIKVSDIVVNADGVYFVARHKGLKYSKHYTSNVVRDIINDCINRKVKVEKFSIYTR